MASLRNHTAITIILFISTIFHIPTNASRLGQSSSQQQKRQLSTIQRIYGPENERVRSNLHHLQQTSTHYWRTGNREDANFKISYHNHPYEILSQERERYRRHLLDNSSSSSTTTTSNKNYWEDKPNELEQEIDRHLANTAPIDESLFQPLRIYYDTATLDAQRTTSNGAKIDLIKNEILPKTGEFWSQALKVVPVQGNLIIQKGELASQTYCGDSEFSSVPTSHFSKGVADTDLILYVSGTPSANFCGATTLAVAVACNFDQYDRPTAGAINFCLDQIQVNSDGTANSAIVDDNIDVAIHETAHVLGMSSNSYRYFWDPLTGKPRTSRDWKVQTVTCVDGVKRSLILPDTNTLQFFMASNGQRYASIMTPTVATVAKNQFNCYDDSVQGGQLENQPTGASSCTGDHWDERLFYPEALSGIIAPSLNILSPLTLALMEDSGWYRADFSKSRMSPWGLGAGCEFVTENCLQLDSMGKTIVPDWGRGFFCTDSLQKGCSPDLRYKMSCTVIDYGVWFADKVPPSYFQYFPNNPTYGGPRQADYCPVYGSTYLGDSYEHDCRNPDNADLINIYFEDYGQDSICVESTSGKGRCYEARCYKDEFIFSLKIRNAWVNCTKDFQEIEVIPGTQAICPRLSSVCPELFCPANCAGRGKCNYEHEDEFGNIRPKCECFNQTDTSEGCAYTGELDGKYLADGEVLKDDASAKIWDDILAVFVDNPDSWSKATWGWAAGMFVIFLLLIFCIFRSFCPSNNRKRR